jgi:hypothetical protein
MSQSTSPDIDFIFSRPQLRFSMTSLYCAAADISSGSGPHKLSSSPQIGYEGSVNYLLTIDRNWSFLTGVNMGVIGRNYDISLSGSEFVPPLPYDLDNFGSITGEKDIWYLKIAVYIQKRWLSKKRGDFFYLEGGVYVGFGLNSAGDAGSDYAFYPNGNSVNYLNSSTNLNNNGKPWVGLGSIFGYQWLLKNQNFLGIHLGINYSDANVGNGNYVITVSNQNVSTGMYHVKDQSVRLGISYQLTKARKRSRE